jgi:hypothetical protein
MQIFPATMTYMTSIDLRDLYSGKFPLVDEDFHQAYCDTLAFIAGSATSLRELKFHFLCSYQILDWVEGSQSAIDGLGQQLHKFTATTCSKDLQKITFQVGGPFLPLTEKVLDKEDFSKTCEWVAAIIRNMFQRKADESERTIAGVYSELVGMLDGTVKSIWCLLSVMTIMTVAARTRYSDLLHRIV